MFVGLFLKKEFRCVLQCIFRDSDFWDKVAEVSLTKTVLGTAGNMGFLVLEMIDGRRRAEKQTAQDYVSGQSLSFQEEKDFIFAEVPVMEMVLVLGASLCSASPCRQVDTQEDELPTVIPVKIFLSFPLLNLLSYVISLPLPPFPWLLSLFLIF